MHYDEYYERDYLRQVQEHANSLKAAKADSENKDPHAEEINFLKQMVKKAYIEGYLEGFIGPSWASNLWDVSDSKKAIENYKNIK